jgi:hypothetical protein
VAIPHIDPDDGDTMSMKYWFAAEHWRNWSPKENLISLHLCSDTNNDFITI